MMTEAAIQRRRVQRKWHSMFILISCCLPMVHSGYSYSIGALFTDVMTTFNTTRAETAVIQSTAVAVFFFSGLFTGGLVKKIGLMSGGMLGCLLLNLPLMACFFAPSITYLVIFVGVLSGIGRSCVYISSAAVLSQHFAGKNQLLYMSIHASGLGIGGMIYPYLIRFLSDQYGFRGVLLIIGAIGLNVLPCCIIWKQQAVKSKRPERDVFRIQIKEFQTNLQVRTTDNGKNITIEKTGEHPPTKESDDIYVSQYPVMQDKMRINTVTIQNALYKSSSNKETENQTLLENIKDVMHNKVFLMFMSGLVVITLTLMSVVIFVADIYKDKRLTNSDVSFGILLINMMAVVGRLLTGVSLQYKYIPTLMLPTLNSMIAAVVILLLTFVKTRWLIIVLTGAYGITMGMFTSMFTVVSLRLVGTNLLPIAIGVILTFISFSQVISGPINGYIRDVTGSYTAIFYIATGINLVGAAVFFAAHITRRKENQAIKRQSSVFYLTSF